MEDNLNAQRKIQSSGQKQSVGPRSRYIAGGQRFCKTAQTTGSPCAGATCRQQSARIGNSSATDTTPVRSLGEGGSAFSYTLRRPVVCRPWSVTAFTLPGASRPNLFTRSWLSLRDGPADFRFQLFSPEIDRGRLRFARRLFSV